MIEKKIEFASEKLDGGQNILPSAFPFYNQNEILKLYSLSDEERVKKIASDMNLQVDGDGGVTVAIDESVFIVDLTKGGEVIPNFSCGVSPSVISAIIGGLGEMQIDGEGAVVSVPLDEGIIISCFLVKLMGFPIESIVAPFNEDEQGKIFNLVDITEEDIVEYIADFYQDFDFLLGVSDARASLSAEIFTCGFEKNTLIVTCFGYNETPSVCCLALSGKKKSDKDSLKWIEINCALPIFEEENSRIVAQTDKKTMKELCNTLNGVKLY